MYEIKTDTHTHTIFSGHAYSTIEENVRAAKEAGMEALGITDHFSRLFVPDTGFCHYGNFGNFKALPKEWYGVRLFYGAEADIVDVEGHLFGYDMELPFAWTEQKPTYQEWLTGGSDYLIASVHDKSYTFGQSLVKTTELYCKALEQPKVLILGHIGRAGVPFELDEVLKTAKALNKMIEINEASFWYPEQITTMCQKIAERCAELGTMISLGSDAHSSFYVGKFEQAQAMLKKIHFPEELIGTRSRNSLEKLVEQL